MLEVVDYIRQNGIPKLVSEFAIKVKRHGTYPNLVLLSYNQIFSPKGVRIVQECRGLILDESANWNPIAMPYVKFYNWGEGYAADIDWNTARVLEKLDGSMMTVYFYDGKWNVSTTGTPDANCSTNNGKNTTFDKLFWGTWNDLGYSMPLDTGCTYIFELMTFQNRVVVKHDKPRIVLHGVRRMRNLGEIQPEPIALAQGWECVQSYPMSSIDEVVKKAETLDGMVSEGFIVCDANFNRIKVKGADYVALHHMTEGFSAKRMLEKIVLPNEGEEFLVYFPEYAPDFYSIKNKFFGLIADAEKYYETVKHIENQKDFALAVANSDYKHACFSVRNGNKGNFEAYYRSLMISSLMHKLGLKDVPEEEV